MKLLAHLEKRKSFWQLFAICFGFFLLRFPSLFEPNWYGDEGIYQVIGYGLSHGRHFYTEVFDNKPPMLFIIYALARGDQFTARLFSLFFGLGAIIAFYFLVRKLFQEPKIHLTTTAFFAVIFGLPIIEGNIANSENFMLFPIIVSANLLYPVFQDHVGSLSSKKRWRLILAGLILSFSFLIKIVSIFDFFAFLLFSFFMVSTTKRLSFSYLLNDFLKMLRQSIWFVIGFITPVIVSFIYFYFYGVLPYYLDAAFGRNVDYVGYANYFIIPQGQLYLRILLLGSILLVLYFKRHLFSKRTLFVLIWLSLGLFDAFFSNRPYTHYQLMLLPSFSVCLGFLFIKIHNKFNVYALITTVILFALLILHFDHWSPLRAGEYYVNFVDLLTKKKDFLAYQSFFDPRNPKDYAIAAYIRKHTHPGDPILLWGNSSQIYPLSKTLPVGRYAAAYHIGINKKAVAETEAAIRKKKPKYIIITPDEQYVPFDLSGYSYVITIEDAHIYERTL